MKKLESLNSKKFESFEDSKLKNLTTILGGTQSTGAMGYPPDASYGPRDVATYLKDGDVDAGHPVGAPTF